MSIQNADPTILTNADPCLVEKYPQSAKRGKGLIDTYNTAVHKGVEDDLTAATDLISDVLIGLNENHDYEEIAMMLSRALDNYAIESFQRSA